MQTKTTLGVIATNRNFFADSLVVDGRRKILEKLAESGIDVVIVDEATTDLGAVETWSDAQKCAALFKQNQDNIDGVLVTLIFPIDSARAGGPPFAMSEDLVSKLLTKEGLKCRLLRKVPKELSHAGREGKEAIAVWQKPPSKT